MKSLEEFVLNKKTILTEASKKGDVYDLTAKEVEKNVGKDAEHNGSNGIFDIDRYTDNDTMDDVNWDLMSNNELLPIDKFDATTSDDSKLPTRGAVKTYVSDQITAFKESLDSDVTLTDFTIVRSGYAADDPYASHKGLQMFDKVELVDGELKSTCRPMSIYDIADFVPLTAADINEICTIE